MKFIFIIPIIALLFVMVTLPEVDAATVIINPVRETIDEETGTVLLGSRIPGCQDDVVVNGTVLREAGCYTPNDIEVKSGTLIIFKNNDISAHSFTSNVFNSQLMINDGTEFTWVATDIGKTVFNCILHPWAVGSITVVSAPTIDDFHEVPEWVATIFNWYDDDVIDYSTFINALVYMMSFNIISDEATDIDDPDSDINTNVKETNIEELQRVLDEKCEEIYSSFSRKKIGCDVPITATVNEELTELEEKCKDVYSSFSRKKLGCDAPPIPVEATNSTSTQTDFEKKCAEIYTTSIKKRLGCPPYNTEPVDSNSTSSTPPTQSEVERQKQIRCDSIDTNKQRLAAGCPKKQF